jgi:hypothetical protein
VLQKSPKKGNDWDELESLLENIDEIGDSKNKKKAVSVERKSSEDEDPLERDRIPTNSALKKRTARSVPSSTC